MARVTPPTILVIAACLTVTAAAQANEPPETSPNEEAEEKPRFEERVTVVAPPIVGQDRVSALSGMVTEVGSRQLDDLAAHDLGAALRRIPGVSIARYNPVGSYGGADGGAFYLRGNGSARPGAEIVTLTEGIPRFVGVWTHPVLDVLDVDAADRIEVFRGAQPVLLGTMAFGAVNLVPRRHTRPGFETRLSADAGSFSTTGTRLQHGGRIGRWDYQVTADRRASDGHREGASGEVEAASGRLGVTLAEGWDASVSFDWSDAWAEDPGAVGSPAPNVRPRFGVRDGFALATLSHRHGAARGTVKLYRDDGAIRWRQWDGTTASVFNTDTDWTNYGLRWREEIRLADGVDAIFGFDSDTYGGRSVERRSSGTLPLIDTDFRNDAPYAALSVGLLADPEITVSAGVRYNHNRDFGGDWGAQGGLTARLGDTRVYLTAARGFNLPGVWAASFYAGWGRADAWRELEPERIDHVEVGAIIELYARTRLTVSLYDDRVSNALRLVPPPPPPPAFANIGSYSTRGGEVSVTFEPSAEIAAFLGAARADSEPEAVPNAPHWSAVAGLAWVPHPRLRLSLDGQWVGSQWVYNPRFASSGGRVDAYALVNLTSSWRLGHWSGAAWRLRAALENLADTDYEVRPGYPMPGRALTLGVDAEL